MDVTACFFHGHHTHTKGLVKPFLTCGLYVADKVLIMQCMVMFLRLFPSVKYSCLHWVLVACVFSATQVFAGNYPLGDMTCPQIGQFASTAMQWREDGVTPEEALQRLENMRPAESVEKKICAWCCLWYMVVMVTVGL
ncbi:MAG: hypothetical protein ACKO69_05820 [Limnohabitans sp.]